MNECQKEQKEQDFNQYDRFVNKIKARVLFTKKRPGKRFKNMMRTMLYLTKELFSKFIPYSIYSIGIF